MRELRIEPELEIYDTGHLDVCLRLAGVDLLEEPLAFSIVMGVEGGTPPTPGALPQLVEPLPEGSVWQAPAAGRANLAITAVGLPMEGDARTGLEDTHMLRRGVPANSNAQLVNVARALERETATTADVERALGLSPRGHARTPEAAS
jgi:3-keto-5-aminohexanoate cleavage enzyme